METDVLNSNEKEILWDFFIAHSSRDGEQALEFYQYLSPIFKVFLDQKCLTYGDDWDIELQRALSKSAIIIALISNDFQSSYYAREEIAMAINLCRKDPSIHKIIPIYLNGMPSQPEQVPYGLRLKHSIDLQGKGGIETVSEELKALIGDYKERIETAETKKTISKHILHQFPRGPMVKAHLVPSSLIQTFSSFIRPRESLQVISDANSFRKEADPDDEYSTIIKDYTLLPPMQVTPYDFWLDAFKEARLNGPRMLAALLMTVPTAQFPERVKQQRQKLLDDLKKFK